jgi:hypothetical protein
VFAIGLLITAAVVGAIGVLVGAVQAVLLGLVRNVLRSSLAGAIGGAVGGILVLFLATVVAYSLLPQHSVHTEFGAATVPNISEEVLIPALWAFGVLGSLVGSAVAAWSQKT